MEGSKTTCSWSMLHKLFLNECANVTNVCMGTINVWLQTCTVMTTNLVCQIPDKHQRVLGMHA